MPKETFFNLNEEKQEKVIRSAVSEFVKHGFEKANIGVIAKNAGVAKGSIYQYFENKKELFMYAVQWSTNLFLRKYGLKAVPNDMDIFDFMLESAKPMLKQLKEERELTIFMQDVILGKYNSVGDESLSAVMKTGDEYALRLIREGKKNGSIRKDIDDHILSMFLTGASMKIKEAILYKARNDGNNMNDLGYDKYENEYKAMMELLKNGMGEKKCL